MTRPCGRRGPKTKVQCTVCGWQGWRLQIARKCPNCGNWHPKEKAVIIKEITDMVSETVNEACQNFLFDQQFPVYLKRDGYTLVVQKPNSEGISKVGIIPDTLVETIQVTFTVK